MALSPLGTLKNKTIFAAAWLTWSIMQVKILRDWGFTAKVAALDSLVSNGLLATFTIILINSLRFYRPQKGKYIYIIVISAVKAALWGVLVKYIMQNIFPGEAAYLDFLDRFMPIRFDIALLIT